MKSEKVHQICTSRPYDSVISEGDQHKMLGSIKSICNIGANPGISPYVVMRSVAGNVEDDICDLLLYTGNTAHSLHVDVLHSF